MTEIFSYTDYRTYLADYFSSQKEKNRNFSYRSFSDKIGFKSKDFIYRIINKNKDISRTSVFKISSAIGHSTLEARYFENLVCFNQAKTAREKEFFFNQLKASEKKDDGKPLVAALSQNQLSLFSEWHYLAIRAIIDIADFKDDYAWLARQVFPAITSKKARAAVAHLEKVGLIRKDTSGVYRVVDKALKTDTELQSVALVKYYLDCFRLSSNALQNLPRSERNVSGVTLGISKKNYTEIVDRIAKFREEIAEIANRDDEAEQVYQLHLSLFPLSERLDRGMV